MNSVRLLSVVVPVFNEQETLTYSVERLLKALTPALGSQCGKIEFIFVNDGSKDDTGAMLEAIAKAQNNPSIDLKILHMSRNFGHSAAVFAGLEASQGDTVAIIDADLQDPPELLPEMIAELDAGNDVVFGVRTERREESAFKKASAWFFYRLLDRLSGIAIPKDTGDFRVMTREVTNALLTCREADPFLRGLVTWVGFIQKPFPYKRDGRKFGTTKYPLSKMLRFAVTAIVSFSDLPLRIALWVGVLGLAFFAIIGTWALFNFLDGHTVPGWTSLLIGFAFGQSITLIVVGVLGYYVGHTFKHVQKRPRYILRESAPRSVTK